MKATAAVSIPTPRFRAVQLRRSSRRSGTAGAATAHAAVFSALEAMVGPTRAGVQSSSVQVRLSRNAALMVQAGMRSADEVGAWLSDRWRVAAFAAVSELGATRPASALLDARGIGQGWTSDPLIVGIGLGVVELAACAMERTDTAASMFVSPANAASTYVASRASTGDFTAHALFDPAWLLRSAPAVATGRWRVLGWAARMPFVQQMLLRDDLASAIFANGAQNRPPLTPAPHTVAVDNWMYSLACIGRCAVDALPALVGRPLSY